MRIQHFRMLSTEAEEHEGDRAADQEEADNHKEDDNDATATATNE